jgi:hypothetical protein
MSNENDITKDIEATDADVADLKKAHYQESAGQTRVKAPVPDVNPGLNTDLVQMLQMGKKSCQFQGLERCIRILDKGTKNARHCMAMMVNDLTHNVRMCSSCDRIKDPNANPTVINSSMIRLTQKELEECGLKADPLINAKPEPIRKAKRLKTTAPASEGPRRTKVKTPNKVTIEMSMEELRSNPLVVKVMLQKTLDAIFELPVSNFREAEQIRIVKERVEEFLNATEPPTEVK